MTPDYPYEGSTSNADEVANKLRSPYVEPAILAFFCFVFVFFLFFSFFFNFFLFAMLLFLFYFIFCLFLGKRKDVGPTGQYNVNHISHFCKTYTICKLPFSHALARVLYSSPLIINDI